MNRIKKNILKILILISIFFVLSMNVYSSEVCNPGIYASSYECNNNCQGDECGTCVNIGIGGNGYACCPAEYIYLGDTGCSDDLILFLYHDDRGAILSEAGFGCNNYFNYICTTSEFQSTTGNCHIKSSSLSSADCCGVSEIWNPSTGQCEPNPLVHGVCVNQECMQVMGPGEPQCYFNSDCTQGSTYMGCYGDNCVILSGFGLDTCVTSNDCEFTPYGDCIGGELAPCPNQLGVCSGTTQVCDEGFWPGCTAVNYLVNNPNYEETEMSCEDGLDNDCDNLVDDNDDDCQNLPSTVATYYYDNDCGNADEINSWGKVCRIEDESGSTEFEYDLRGRITKQIIKINGEEPEDINIYEILYTYDSADNLRTETLPNGIVIEYEYNALNQLEDIELNDVSLASFEYNPIGTISNIGFGNYISTEYTYNVREWLETINTEDVFNRKYEYDPVGNLEQLKYIDNTLLATYDYDDLYRLTGVDDNNYYNNFNDLSFGYDLVGNRLRRTMDGIVENFNYYSNTNRLECVAGSQTCAGVNIIDLQYDAVGNQIRKVEEGGSIGFDYDYNNMIEGVDINEDEIIDEEYIYNYNNQRVKKLDYENDIKTIYVYDIGGNMVYEEEGSTGACYVINFMGGGSKFRIQDSGGNDIAAVDENGLMIIKGNLYENYLGGPIEDNNFVIEDEGGAIKIWIDNEGNLYLKGDIIPFVNTLQPASNKELIIQNSNDENVAIFNDQGNLKLRSCLAANINVQNYI